MRIIRFWKILCARPREALEVFSLETTFVLVIMRIYQDC